MKNQNKQNAVSFLTMIVDGAIEAAYKKYAHKSMIHHNPYFSGDAKSLQKGMEENHQEFPNKILDVQHSIAEGDVVAVHSHLRMNEADRGMAVVHILRFEDNKIVEMWDIGQQVPENSVNESGMF